MPPPLSWYYMWSPKFEVFHRIIQDTFRDKDVQLHPIYLDQSCFDKELYKAKGQHHWSGCVLKLDLLLERMRLTEHKDQYIVFSDADIYARPGIGAKLNEYIKDGKDMYFLQETFEAKSANIGLNLLKCTEEVRRFWEGVRDEVLREGTHDQTVTNQHLAKTSLSWGYLDQTCMNSNMINHSNVHTFLYCQMLCSCRGYEPDMAEKLFSYLNFFSLEPYLPFIDPVIQACLAQMHDVFKLPIPMYIKYRLGSQ
jgi:hypothetical protein